MGQQNYLVRKGARYHFRRRLSDFPKKRPIMIALGTSDPSEARRLARRLAVRWDEIAMEFTVKEQRYTLTLEEQEALFREGLKAELARATAHQTAPIGNDQPHVRHHKVMAGAYNVVARVRHDAQEIDSAVIDSTIGSDWSAEELNSLSTVLRILVTPMAVSKAEAKEALQRHGGPMTEPAIQEARAHMLRGYAEAHERAALIDQAGSNLTRNDVMALLDDLVIKRAREAIAQQSAAPISQQPVGERASAPQSAPHPTTNSLFMNTTTVCFSEQIDDLHSKLFADNNWQPDDGKTRNMLEAFAWLTGDKAMSDYTPADIDDFARNLAVIPTNFKWGRLGKSGGMAKPFDRAAFGKPEPDKRRSDRTINSYLSKLQSASDILKKTYWLPQSGYGQVMNFNEARRKVAQDPNEPKRMPLTIDHLKVLYGLPLWHGAGGMNNRLKCADKPKIYQDAAYWVPILSSYSGMSREEACGLELVDIAFDAATPYLLVRANMTKSKDGQTPAGLKRASRARAIPLHPEILRLGFKKYVDQIAQEEWDMLFPELYGKRDSHGNFDRWEKAGGARFYRSAWQALIDATHAILPLPKTASGKYADFHSQRTWHYSAMASDDVSEALLARHIGHSQSTTGGRNYNRRALALGEEKELAERLKVMLRELPNVTSHIPTPPAVNLLHLNHRSRVGSAPGRSVSHRFLA